MMQTRLGNLWMVFGQPRLPHAPRQFHFYPAESQLQSSDVPMQAVSSNFLAEKLSYVRDASWSYNLVSERGISTAGSERSSGKAFADFSIFKGKAALLMSPVPPTFTKMDSGHQRVDKKGVILLKFIPAIGQRKYDSERKQRALKNRPKTLFAAKIVQDYSNIVLYDKAKSATILSRFSTLGKKLVLIVQDDMEIGLYETPNANSWETKCNRYNPKATTQQMYSHVSKIAFQSPEVAVQSKSKLASKQKLAKSGNEKSSRSTPSSRCRSALTILFGIPERRQLMVVNQIPLTLRLMIVSIGRLKPMIFRKLLKRFSFCCYLSCSGHECCSENQ
ncbi:hypothetical protein M5K25_001999 [Dendrobium thyrsiflorum]|uniref:Uncharacterized protein n=1 Tax=Dendrobium thyrsiflorum TaxID=117978 RepID=A0ABD0VRG2_DENTH